LTGLLQYYCAVLEKEKTRTLVNLLGKLNYNQVIIFCSSIQRAKHLNDILNDLELESITIHRDMPQEERYIFKESKFNNLDLPNTTNLSNARRES
jgi:superfamily II DNA/RNA helicase